MTTLAETVTLLWQGQATRPALYEYFLVGAAVVVLVWVFYRAVRVSVWPREDDPGHIKRLVLEDEEKKANE